MYRENLKRLMNTFSQEMVIDLASAMKAEGSKTLADTLKYTGLKEDLDVLISTIEGDIGIKYMYSGRQAGRMPPLEDIKSWIQKHNIQSFKNKTLDKADKLVSLDSMAYAIGKKIMDFGTKKDIHHFMEKFRM